MEIHLVWQSSEAFLELLELRRQFLRLPLGLDYSPEDLEAEDPETILGMEMDGRWIGCLHLRPGEGDVIKLRQMIVHPDFEGQGFGRALVEAAETIAGELGHSEIVLHARESAIGFYESCGFERQGEVFQEVTLSHLLMRKKLTASKLERE